VVGTIGTMGEGGTIILPRIVPIITQAGNAAWSGLVVRKNSVARQHGGSEIYATMATLLVR
jgi:hypothetical protein